MKFSLLKISVKTLNQYLYQMIIDLHTHQLRSGDFSIFNAFIEETTLSCSYGIHPWYVDKCANDSIEKMESLIQQENCFAIGECGLDKKSDADWNVQMNYFETQIKLSEKYQKPLIIHCVKAIQELILLKRKYQPKQVWIFHGFRKINVAQQLLDEGFYLSIGSALLTDNNLAQVVSELPLERLFLETDDKEMKIQSVYLKMMEIRQISSAQLEEAIQLNFQKVFNRSPLTL